MSERRTKWTNKDVYYAMESPLGFVDGPVQPLQIMLRPIDSLSDETYEFMELCIAKGREAVGE